MSTVVSKAGDAQGAQPETRAVVAIPATTKKPAIVLKLHGNFGWVLANLLSWVTQRAGLGTVTFTDVRTQSCFPLPHLSFRMLKFRPAVVVPESGNLCV